MIGIKWYADFKEGPQETDRRKWDDRRDLVIEFDAVNSEHARSRAFELAYEHGMTAPFLGKLISEGIEMRKGQKKISTSPVIIAFLQGRAGKSTSIEQIIKETGLTAEQIRSALAHFRSKGTGNIETLVRGNMWRWVDSPVAYIDPTPQEQEQPVEQLPIEADDEKGFYQLGVAQGGQYVILQKDSDGTIWKAVQL